MFLNRYLKHAWSFYKNFAFVSISITAFCLETFWEYGMKSFMGVFWLKVVSFGLIYIFINSYKSNEYYYFQNLGISKKTLWVLSFSIDLSTLVLLISAIQYFK